MPLFGRTNIPSARTGFTLVELLVVVAILGVLALMAIPTFNQYVTTTKSNRCIADIRSIDKAITAYLIEKTTLPPGFNLATVGMDGQRDPWGRQYYFQNFADPGATPLEYPDTSQINTDYDLYSYGANGESSIAYDAAKTEDDIVRANNGITVDRRP